MIDGNQEGLLHVAKEAGAERRSHIAERFRKISDGLKNAVDVVLGSPEAAKVGGQRAAEYVGEKKDQAVEFATEKKDQAVEFAQEKKQQVVDFAVDTYDRTQRAVVETTHRWWDRAESAGNRLVNNVKEIDARMVAKQQEAKNKVEKYGVQHVVEPIVNAASWVYELPAKLADMTAGRQEARVSAVRDKVRSAIDEGDKSAQEILREAQVRAAKMRELAEARATLLNDDRDRAEKNAVAFRKAAEDRRVAATQRFSRARELIDRVKA